MWCINHKFKWSWSIKQILKYNFVFELLFLIPYTCVFMYFTYLHIYKGENVCGNSVVLVSYIWVCVYDGFTNAIPCKVQRTIIRNLPYVVLRRIEQGCTLQINICITVCVCVCVCVDLYICMCEDNVGENFWEQYKDPRNTKGIAKVISPSTFDLFHWLSEDKQ